MPIFIKRRLGKSRYARLQELAFGARPCSIAVKPINQIKSSNIEYGWLYLSLAIVVVTHHHFISFFRNSISG